MMILIKDREHEEQIQMVKQREEEIRRLRQDFDHKVAIEKLNARNGTLFDAMSRQLPRISALSNVGERATAAKSQLL